MFRRFVELGDLMRIKLFSRPKLLQTPTCDKLSLEMNILEI